MAATVVVGIADAVCVPGFEILGRPEWRFPAAVPMPEMGMAGLGVVPLGLTKGQIPDMRDRHAGAYGTARAGSSIPADHVVSAWCMVGWRYAHEG